MNWIGINNQSWALAWGESNAGPSMGLLKLGRYLGSGDGGGSSGGKKRQEKIYHERSRVGRWRGRLGAALRVSGPFGCRCPSSPPCPVSTSPSSNRICAT